MFLYIPTDLLPSNSMLVPSSNGDVWLHKSPVASWLPASVLEQVPGVGVAAASHGHAPDRCHQHSLPKLWYGRPSALQPELPGLHPCRRQCGTHSLPQPHGAQVEWWVWKSERGVRGKKEKMISPNKGEAGWFKLGLEVLMKCCWERITELVRGHTAWCCVEGQNCFKQGKMMDLLFALARVGLSTKHRGGAKLRNKLKIGSSTVL